MTTLRPFQIEGVHQIYRFRGRALLADEMGLGKTLQALYWILKTPKHRPVVVVCPASLKWTWQAEALLHFNIRADVIDGRWCRGRQIPSGDVLIINYDILGSWLRKLLPLRPLTVIIDECQFIKSMRAQRTRWTLRLAQLASSVVAMSGTPLVNRPYELWPVLQAVRPDLFPSEREFAWEYCAPRWTFFGWKFDGATNVKKLNRILREECMIRRLKKDVLHDLPPKQHAFVYFKLRPREQEKYQEAEEHFLRWLAKISLRKARKAARAQAVVKVGYLIRLAVELKLPYTIQWIRDFFEGHPGKKLVVFTSHRIVVDKLRAAFPDRCVVVDGRVTGQHRQDAVRQFRSHRKKDLFIGNWIAAGVGLTLVSAHHVVALDFPWTPGELAQGGDRVHRIGQTQTSYFHFLALLDTIEQKQVGYLRRKSRVLGAVLDNTKQTKDASMLDALLKDFERRM